MKNIFIITLLFLSTVCVAQKKLTPKIELSNNAVASLVFPTQIEKVRGGFNPEEFALEQYENIYYIQPLLNFDNSNLTIITEDKLIYMINISYNQEVVNNYYEFTVEDAVNYKSKQLQAPKSTYTPQTKKDTTKSIGSIKIENNNPIMEKIVQQKGFIFNGNGVKKNGMEAYLTGIYVNGNDMYFQLEVSNKSFVKFDYNFFGFSIEIKKKGNQRSYSRVDIQPTGIYLPNNHLSKNTTQIVYKLNKISISNEKHLLIEIFEGNGERNISFTVDAATILQARPIS